MPEEMDDALDRFAARKVQQRVECHEDVNPGITVPWLMEQSRQRREELRIQRWAHVKRFLSRDPKERALAASLHDWDACPLCDRIDGGSRHDGPAGPIFPDLAARRDRAKEKARARRKAHRDRQKARRSGTPA